MNTIKPIHRLHVGIIDPHITQERSIVHVTEYQILADDIARSNTVFDPRMGPFGYGRTCATCHSSYHECPGHFGHIQCIQPFFQPFFLTKIYKIIQKSCWNCFHPCLTTMCFRCDHRQGKWYRSGTLKDQFYHRAGRTKKEVSSTDIMKILKLYDNENPSQQPASWLLTTVLPVMPPASRPSILHKGRWMHNSLTHTYCNIIKENKVLQAFVEQGQPSHIINTQWRRTQNVLYKIYDVKPSTTDRLYVEGIRQRLDGKQGRFRKNLMGTCYQLTI